MTGLWIDVDDPEAVLRPTVADEDGCVFRIGGTGYECRAHAGEQWEVAKALGMPRPRCERLDLVSLTAAHARRSRNPSLLKELACATEPRVAGAVAGNRNTPREVVKRLVCMSEEARIRRAAAGNPACPPEVLDELALCDDPSIRRAVASNAATSQYVLDLLAKEDENSEIRRTAERTLRTVRSPAGRRVARWRARSEGWS